MLGHPALEYAVGFPPFRRKLFTQRMVFEALCQILDSLCQIISIPRILTSRPRLDFR